jgi:hypothetical protein
VPRVDPKSELNIPAGHQRIKIKNLSQTKAGACNVFIDENSTNVQLAANESKYVDLYDNSAILDNTGSTELEVTYE